MFWTYFLVFTPPFLVFSSSPKTIILSTALEVLRTTKPRSMGPLKSFKNLKWFSEASIYNQNVFKNVPILITMMHQLKIADHCCLSASNKVFRRFKQKQRRQNNHQTRNKHVLKYRRQVNLQSPRVRARAFCHGNVILRR